MESLGATSILRYAISHSNGVESLWFVDVTGDASSCCIPRFSLEKGPRTSLSVVFFCPQLISLHQIYIISQLLGGIVGAAVVYANYFHAIDLFEGHGVRTLSTASLFSTYSVSLPFSSRVTSAGSQRYFRYQARLHDKCVLLLWWISRNDGPYVCRIGHEWQEQLPTTGRARAVGSIYSHLGNWDISGHGDRYVSLSPSSCLV